LPFLSKITNKQNWYFESLATFLISSQ